MPSLSLIPMKARKRRRVSTILCLREGRLKLRIKEKIFRNILEKKVTEFLFMRLVKSFNTPPVYYHNTNFMRGQSHSHSFFGPIKGRYVPSRNFKPY